jgi:hypothetical protein
MARKKTRTSAAKGGKAATTTSTKSAAAVEKFRDELLHPTDRANNGLRIWALEARQAFFQEHLGSAAAFKRFVERHPNVEALKVQIRTEVALHRPLLERLKRADEGERPESATQRDPGKGPRAATASEFYEYQLLATANYVEPSFIFPEVPAAPSICELMRSISAFARSKTTEGREKPDEEILSTEWGRSLESFRNRWYVLTQQRVNGPPYPTVSALTQRIAPVPYTTCWTDELRSREAASMGHRPSPSTLASDIGPSGTLNSDSTAPRCGRESSGAQAGTSEPGCSIDEIYRLAGAQRLRQERLSSEEARFNFPGKLGWGEDIFYDYAVVVPVESCEVGDEVVGPIPRNLEASRMLTGFAKGLLDFLATRNLDRALGRYTVPDPNNPSESIDKWVVVALGESLRLVEAFQEVSEPTNPPRGSEPGSATSVRMLRRRLREHAALLRSISRTRLLLPNYGQNPFAVLAALDSALTAFPRVAQVSRAVPTVNELPVRIPTLEIEDAGPPLPPENGMERRSVGRDGLFSVPDAVNEDLDGPVPPEPATPIGTPLELHWSWPRAADDAQLRRYVQYLGGTFFQKVSSLHTAAQTMRDAVRTSSGAELEQLASGLINDVVLALSRIFDEIAESLPLAPVSRGEGSKRLALMLVYRQFWFPEGYVAGKLVGYKNLLPNQKDTFRRRTFVKTTRELSTVQEFAASREEDFSHSSRETAELVREASSDFNLSVKTEAGFDFLVASADIATDTSYGLKETSKSVQNRMAEASTKAANKYNEKREVKIRELSEAEDLQEVTTELQNLNREITANYFYYQLHRQYCVVSELARVQPVLLRTREVPTPATVDEKFLSDHAHVLVRALPRQLSADLQETVGQVEQLGRAYVRWRSDADLKSAAFDELRRSPPSSATAEEQNRWRAQVEVAERGANVARTLFIDAEERYVRARTRFDRVMLHVRGNICHYMGFIWQTLPKVDQDRLLQDETFSGQPLNAVTRGLMRLGYYGDEEIFEYTGRSLECLHVLMDNLVAGHQLAQLQDLRSHPLFQRLRRQNPAESDEAIIERVRAQAFIRDPAAAEGVDNSRRVQVSQDAVVVEAMPGQVPLLEGFQMAHRVLDVQKACLENEHLSERIKRGFDEDSYKVVRREGATDSVKVVVSDDSASAP